MEERMQKEDTEKSYNPYFFRTDTSDISMIQMEISMLKRQMEKSMAKAQMEKTIDDDPLAFDISPTDNTRKRVMVEEDDLDDSSDQMSLDISRKSKFKKQMEMSMPPGQMEMSMSTTYGPKCGLFDFDISTTDLPASDRHHRPVTEAAAFSTDISRKMQMEMSMPPGQMEMSMPKAQMEKSMPKAQMEMTLDDDPFAFDISTTDDPMIDEQIGKREDVDPIHLEHDTNVPKSSDILPSWDMKDKDDSISSTEKHWPIKYPAKNRDFSTNESI